MTIPTISLGEASPPDVLDAAKAAVDCIFAQPEPNAQNVLSCLALVIINVYANLPLNWPKLEAEFGHSRDQSLAELAMEAGRVLRQVDDVDAAGHA